MGCKRGKKGRTLNRPSRGTASRALSIALSVPLGLLRALLDPVPLLLANVARVVVAVVSKLLRVSFCCDQAIMNIEVELAHGGGPPAPPPPFFFRSPPPPPPKM